ncbi:MAG: GntR family transcriptional regulator [Saccharospirillaceae bacterium]|nr:GntR family transcriptional regulator [Pseudomonadales bacterium]NRB78327.1 GntR family transcriptional regulator [Saccharospirillaceae bacterium]
MTKQNFINLFSINTSSGIPIYRQLIDQIKQAIQMNLLKPEQQLPSVRAMATSLQINPMTISKAYAQLEVEGILIRKRGIGMLIAPNQQATIIAKEVTDAITHLTKMAKKHNLTDESIQTLLQQTLSVQFSKEKKQ